MDDDKIIDLFWQRNEMAIEAAGQKYQRYCFSIGYDILKNKEDVEECVNDTYFRAWEAIPPTKPNNLAVFLGTITRRLALNLYKKKRADKRGGGQVEIVLSELEEAIPDGSASLEKELEREEIIKTINGFLKDLPEKQRNVFVRRYWHMKSIEDIAKDYQLTISNVKQMLFRARKQLKLRLEEEGVYL